VSAEPRPSRRALPTALAAAGLFAVNAAITFRLFHIEYLREMGSIEAAYIGLARYILEHFPDFNWFPLWYGGIPYQDSYPPLLHFLVAAVAASGRISPALAYHAVTAALYALAPAALFWAAWRLGASRTNAFLAALLYSLISPSCWLVREVRADTGGWFGPRRLVTLVHYGEGPHLAALLFLPLAIGLLHVALQKRRPLWYAAAALAIAAVVLSNWIGAFALALAVASYLLAGFARPWLRTAALGCAAYALAMPWAPPSTIATIRANAPLVGGRYVPDLRVEALFAAGLLLLAWVMRRLKWEPRIRFGVLFLYGTAYIALGAYWFHQRLLPQPERYHLEMDLAFCLAAALVAPRIPRLAALAVAALLIPVALHQHSMAQRMEQPIDIASTAEYRISRWLGRNLPGRRVFAPGSIGFWMNAFSDTPMLTGGFDNGMRNTFLQDVNYQIYAGDRQETALDWLEAFGCDAIAGGDPESGEVYHPIAHPEKLHGLRELWRDGPEVVYDVPRRSRSLAHAVGAAGLVRTRPPAYDSAGLKPYIAALDDPSSPAAQFQWRGPSAASIAGDFRPEHLLSVQIAWDAGWNARVDGRPRRTWADNLGQMVVEPLCSGPCTVELIYDGGAEMRFARWLSRLVLAAGALWILLARYYRPRATRSPSNS